MSEMVCLSCMATTTNGLALCERCRIKAKVDLEFLPIEFRNLARWRPGRAGARPVPGSREPRGESREASDRVTRALDEVGADLTGWARSLADDRPNLARMLDRLAAADLTEAETMRWLCRGFDRYLTSVATLEWAGEFVIAVGAHEARLRKLTEAVVPGWYAGACRQCAASTFVVPGWTWVTCGTCGVTTYARDHLDVVLNEARAWVARPMRLAEAAVALLDTEQSVPRLHKRISKWGERGPESGGIESLRRLDSDGDPVGPKRYRFGDVLDKLLNEGATQVGDVTSKAS